MPGPHKSHTRPRPKAHLQKLVTGELLTAHSIFNAGQRKVCFQCSSLRKGDFVLQVRIREMGSSSSSQQQQRSCCLLYNSAGNQITAGTMYSLDHQVDADGCEVGSSSSSIMDSWPNEVRFNKFCVVSEIRPGTVTLLFANPSDYGFYVSTFDNLTSPPPPPGTNDFFRPTFSYKYNVSWAEAALVLDDQPLLHHLNNYMNNTSHFWFRMDQSESISNSMKFLGIQ